MKKLEDYLYYEETNPDLKIYHGDCLEIMPLLPKVDLVVTDPPYGVNLGYDVYADTEENWYKLMRRFIPEIKELSTMSIFPSCQIKRMKFFYDEFPPDWIIAWYKGSPGHVSAIGFNDWEPHVVYGRNKGINMHDYFYVQPDTKDSFYKDHPCPKNVKWASWLIERAIGKGNLVLDPFLGSGTTIVACKELNRNGIGIEISEKYCDIAKKRLKATCRSLF